MIPAPIHHFRPKTALQRFGRILSIALVICAGPAAAAPAEKPKAGEIDPQGKAEIDSLLRASWALARVKPTESLAILGRIEGIQAMIDTAYKADVVDYYYGVFYKNLNRYRESEASFERYEAYQKNKENLSKVAAVNMVKANLYSDMGDVARSMESVAYALQLYETLEDTLGIIRTGSKLGFLLAEAGRTEEAKNYHRRSQRLAQRIEDFSEESIALTNIALVHEKEGVYDSALTYHSLAYLIAERSDDTYSKSLNRHNMANILTLMNRPREALPYAEACMTVSDSLDLPSHRVAAMSLLANVWLELGETEKAVALLDSAVHGPYGDLGLRDRIELFAVRAKAYRLKEDYKAAFENFTTYKSLSDSLFNIESRNRLNELEIAYENDKQKQRISFLDLENQASKALISQKDRTILVGGIGLMLLLAFSAGLYLLQRKYLRQKAVLAKALDDKDLLLREIHHRVKNNLQVVSSLLSLQGRSLDDASAREAVKAGKSRVRSMALIHQDLYLGENLTGVKVNAYLPKLCNELFRSFGTDEDRVSLGLDVEDLELDVDTLVPLGLIVNELVTNALKYAFPGNNEGLLQVSLRKEAQSLRLRIADNGPGFDPDGLHPASFGRKLVQSLVKQLDGTLHTESRNGTAVTLEIRKFRIA